MRQQGQGQAMGLARVPRLGLEPDLMLDDDSDDDKVFSDVDV